MWSLNKYIGRLLGIIMLFLLIAPISLFGEESDKESKTVRQGSLQEESKSKSDFILTIKDNLISLDAKDASLVEILEEMGSRMKIDVITKITEEKRITTKFDKLPLGAAIERLREYADIVYTKHSEEEKAKITKMLVFPKGKGEELSKPIEEEESMEPESSGEETVETPRPEPFKFEFDPSEFEEEQ